MKQKFKTAFLLFFPACLTVFGGLGLADAPTVRITVDPGRVIAEIKPFSIGGMNVNNAMMIAKIQRMVDALKIPTITYPAGNIADEENLIDTNSEAALSFFKIQQKLLNNPFTFVQVRLYKGTPEMAAAAVRRAKEIGNRVDVWTIGNEPDLYAPNKGDKSWTQEKYNRVFREFAAAMRAVDPEIKLAGPVPCQPKDDWIKPFITECGDIVDVLTWHWYPTNGQWSDESALATADDVIEQINRYRAWLKDPEINPKGYRRDIKLAITEYALHWNTPNFRHLTDMVAAMWTAEAVGYMAQYGLDYSHYFCLGEYGGHAVFEQSPSYMERPVYYVFLFYAQHFGRTMVASSSSDPEVKVFASKDKKGKNYLILINQDPRSAKETVVESTQVGLEKRKLRGFVLDNERSGEELPPDSLKIVDGRLWVVLPPYSVVAVEM